MTVMVGIATCLDVLMGPGSQMSTEEAYNAASGALLACGHLESLWALQYKWFCGGCTTEAALAAPLFKLLGPSVFAWKWFVGCIHVTVVAAGVSIAGRAGGARSAFVFAGLMLAAPGFYRELALTGFGNHAESTVFPFLSAAILLSTHKRSRAAKVGAAIAAGILMGFGIWFSPTVLHGFLAVLVIAVAAGPIPSIAYVLSLPVGLIPFMVYFRTVEVARRPAAEWWGTIDFAPLGDLFQFVGADFAHTHLWPFVGTGGSSLWWFTLAALAVIGMGAMFTRTERPWAVRWFVPLCFVGLFSGYFVRFDLWSDNPAAIGYDPFNLRYRAPMFPLMALGAALTSGAMEEGSILRKISAGFVVVLIAVGFVFRVNGWNIGQEPVFKTSAIQIDGRFDASVPEGEPPTRLPREMSRAVDIVAAVNFVNDHDDSLPVCRQLHLSEVGRRVGEGLVSRRSILDLAPALTLATSLEGEDRDAFIRGLSALFEHKNRRLGPDWNTVKPLLDRSVPDLARAVDLRIQRVNQVNP